MVKEGQIFSQMYLDITRTVVENGDCLNSRNGEVLELLNFQTVINEPEFRCVGGYSRNINIFFLLFEAMWIWLGKKDVEPLLIFNSNMKNFSDDGKTFHAPYGFRLRKYGVASDFSLFKEMCIQQNLENYKYVNHTDGKDQIEEAIKMLSSDNEDRRVVMSIWNPHLDLNFKCKDIPCNDMVMLKVRDGKLHLTVQNRSNDLHWGLPTNVFQFSFIGTLISQILGVKYGSQTHNSQSLHLYMNNPITLRLLNSKQKNELYNQILRQDFKFRIKNQQNVFDFGCSSSGDVVERLNKVDNALMVCYEYLLQLDSELKGLKLPISDLKIGVNSGFKYFDSITKLLALYIFYKNLKQKDGDVRTLIINAIIEGIKDFPIDVAFLAISFFANRGYNESGLSDDAYRLFSSVDFKM